MRNGGTPRRSADRKKHGHVEDCRAGNRRRCRLRSRNHPTTDRPEDRPPISGAPAFCVQGISENKAPFGGSPDGARSRPVDRPRAKPPISA